MDLGDLPFDMPKLRRRMRLTPQPTCGVSGVIQTSTESSGVSQASSSHSVREDKPILGKIELKYLKQKIEITLG